MREIIPFEQKSGQPDDKKPHPMTIPIVNPIRIFQFVRFAMMPDLIIRRLFLQECKGSGLCDGPLLAMAAAIAGHPQSGRPLQDKAG